MGLLVEVAVKLGVTLVKCACEAATGQKVLGDIGGDLTAVFGGKAIESLDNRKARRRIEEVADDVADQIDKAYGHEFRNLTEDERAVVVEAVSETLELVPPAAGLTIEVDFDARKLERQIRALTGDYRAGRHFGQDETDLYDLVLRMSCAAMVGIVHGLPGLADAAVPDILRRLTNLGDEARREPRRALVEAAKDSDSAFAEVYRRYVGDELDTIDLDSDRLSSTSRHYPLSRAYVSLPALVHRESAQILATRIEAAFANRSRVLLRAHCGGGKTTYLYRLFTLAARRSLTGELAELNAAVPFYLPLHRYAEGDLPSIDDLVSTVGRDIASEMPAGWIQRQLRDGESLVLINGVDEVPAERRPAVLDWIRKLADRFDRPRYLLTSRPGAVAEDWVAAARFEVVDLLPMGPGDARAFICRWHDAVKSTLTSDAARAQVDACADRLMDALASCHALRALSANPLTCALMCALHRDNLVDLPDGWLDLIRMVVEILVSERDRERGVTDGLALSTEQRIHTLQDIAYWMVREDLVAPAVGDVLERIRHLLAGMGMTGGNGSVQPSGVLDYLAARSGLIHVRLDGTLSFTVPILRDYLAAREAVSGGSIRSLLRESHLVERHQLVVMAAGHAQLARAEELLSGLLVRALESVDTRDRFQVLAQACLRAVPGLGSELREQVEACCSSPAPRTEWEAEALALSGPLVVDALSTQPTDDVEVVLALIHAAAHIGGDDVLPFLSRLAADNRPEVREALQAASSRFDAAEYDRVVLAGWLLGQELVRSTLQQAGGGGVGG